MKASQRQVQDNIRHQKTSHVTETAFVVDNASVLQMEKHTVLIFQSALYACTSLKSRLGSCCWIVMIVSRRLQLGSWRLQLGSLRLLSPVLISNPEPPQPPQLDLGHVRKSSNTNHPHRGLPVGHTLWLLGFCPPRRAFLFGWMLGD